MKSDDGDVLLSSVLLGLDKSSCSLNTNNETPSHLKSLEFEDKLDLGIESSTVTSLLNSKNALNPRNNLSMLPKE